MNRLRPLGASMSTVVGMNGIVVVVILGMLAGCYGQADGRQSNPSQPGTYGGSAEPEDFRFPFSPDLEKVLRSQGVGAMMLLKRGQIVLVSPAGRQIKPSCSLINDTEIPDSCGLDGIDLKNLNSVEVFSFEKNPSCDGIRINQNVYTWHLTDDPSGRWKVDHEPCHVAGITSHHF